MVKDFYKQIIAELTQHGYVFKREAKGSHEIWWEPESGKSVTVPHGTQSRHTANAILKAAGIGKKF